MSYGRSAEAFFFFQRREGWGGGQSDEDCGVGRLRQLCEVIFRECKRERGAD